MGGAGIGAGDEAATYSKVQADVRRELQNTYRPEFLNRLDEIIVFRPLSRPEAGGLRTSTRPTLNLCFPLLLHTYARLYERGVTKIKHSVDVEPPTPTPPRVCVSSALLRASTGPTLTLLLL
jgi:hypothetical protein